MHKLLCLLLLILASCTPNTVYTRLPQAASSLIVEGAVTERRYSLAFIELDDNGDLWNQSQLEYALKEISYANRARSGSGAIVAVYVHGWKHNASEEDSNLVAFRKEVLQKIANEEHH